MVCCLMNTAFGNALFVYSDRSMSNAVSIGTMYLSKSPVHGIKALKCAVHGQFFRSSISQAGHPGFRNNAGKTGPFML